MGLYSGWLIVGRIFASEIWGLIFGRAIIIGGAYYQNFTVTPPIILWVKVVLIMYLNFDQNKEVTTHSKRLLLDCAS